MRENADRFCRNPYFLHSVTAVKQPDMHSQSAFAKTRATSKASRMYQGSRTDGISMSDYGLGRTGSKRRSKASRVGSEGTFEGMTAAPRLRRKVRPFSAPRHQQMRGKKLGSNLLASQPQQVNYAYGGAEQDADQLIREEEDEQLVYEDPTQVQNEQYMMMDQQMADQEMQAMADE